MPTYEYICEKCGHPFEKFQSIADKALEVCPQDVCPQKKWGKGRVKKQISAGAGLIFKGSGFYITDYRSDKYKEAAKADNKTSPSADAPKDSSSTSKPESTPDKSTTPAAPEKTTKPKKKSSD